MGFCDVLPLTTNAEIGASGLLDWPTYGPINTYFSQWHLGLDIAPPFGTPVKAADSGLVVTTAQEPWGFGWHILLFHGERMTVYTHLSQISVELGEKVNKDQQIGRVGSTGKSTGDHLHFEVIQKTENSCNQINPLNMLP